MTDHLGRSRTSFDRYVARREREDPTLRQRIEDAKRDMFGPDDDCPGCGAPAGFPPSGPCDNHGTAEAKARV